MESTPIYKGVEEGHFVSFGDKSWPLIHLGRILIVDLKVLS